MLAGLYVVRCYISCLPRLCSVLLHGEKKHKKWFMNINKQAGIPNLKLRLNFWRHLFQHTFCILKELHSEGGWEGGREDGEKIG